MPKKQPPLLQFENACISRGGKPVLQNIDLRILAGENVAILGPNGSGKSSLIKTLTRECYPSGKTVKIWGKDDWVVSELRSLLGVVTNDLQRFFEQEITGREMVLSGFFSSVGLASNHTVTPAMEKKTKQLLRFLELSHLADRTLPEISDGEARRLLIARALVHDPKALVLDEPANSLDPAAQLGLVRALRKIARSGKSVILATHHLPDIIPEIKRIVMLKGGRIFRDGPKEEVLTEKNMRELFAANLKLEKRAGFYQAWGF